VKSCLIDFEIWDRALVRMEATLDHKIAPVKGTVIIDPLIHQLANICKSEPTMERIISSCFEPVVQSAWGMYKVGRFKRGVIACVGHSHSTVFGAASGRSLSVIAPRCVLICKEDMAQQNRTVYVCACEDLDIFLFRS
jgi:hypothetical protein